MKSLKVFCVKAQTLTQFAHVGFVFMNVGQDC